jgi:hypothetical protein
MKQLAQVDVEQVAGGDTVVTFVPPIHEIPLFPLPSPLPIPADPYTIDPPTIFRYDA